MSSFYPAVQEEMGCILQSDISYHVRSVLAHEKWLGVLA